MWDQAVFGMNDRLLGGVRLSSSKSVSGIYWAQVAWLSLSDSLTWIPFKENNTSTTAGGLTGFETA